MHIHITYVCMYIYSKCLWPLLIIEKAEGLNITLFTPYCGQCIDRSVVLSPRDVMSLGITLVGHQKKIMSSIQTMRAQMLHIHGTGVQV